MQRRKPAIENAAAKFAEAPEPEPVRPESLEALLQRGYRFAFSLSHDPARAEDLLQEAWVSVLRARGPHTRGYLFATIRSRFVDQARRRLIVQTESLDSQPRLSAEVEAGFWSEPCIAPPVRTVLQRALGRLRPEERAVLLLSTLEGYTAREIGELLDAPRGTILSLMHRTRAKLRHWLNEDPQQETP